MAPEQGPACLPVHVGIIMDGNGRWARQRGAHRSAGHREGLKAAKRVVRAASTMGIRYLSLFTFSTENWKRAEREVSYLMFLIRRHLAKEYDFYRENQIRVVSSGDLSRVPEEVRREVARVVEDTAGYAGLTVNLAINYGGRDEILRALDRLAASGERPPFTERQVRSHLDQPDMPDPDLIIRTGREQRISNFLLWEMAYSELYFSPKLWPDWDGADLQEAVSAFQSRQRRFGAALE